MGYIISVSYLLIFLLSGSIVSEYLFTGEKALVRLTLSLSLGLIGLMWYPALFAFLFDFTDTAIFFALGASVITGAVFAMMCTKRKKAGLENRTLSEGLKSLFTDLKSDKAAIFVIIPFFVFTAYLLHTHVLRTNSVGALESGQSTFGDMAMHLSFITSVSVQKSFPPSYNLIAGNIPVGYPFLCDSISSVFFSLTGDHRFSYLLPMFPAILTVFMAVYIFLESWLKDKSKAAFATVLFLLGGGFGFAYFFDLLRTNGMNFSRIFSGFYTTPTNYVDKNIIWVNPIADMLIPQRSTLFGWVVLIPCLYLLYRAAFENKRVYFVPLGVMAGALPLIHTHSFLALAIVSAVYLIRAFIETDDESSVPASLGIWFVYAGIALALSLPQLLFFTFKQASGDNFLRLSLNWVNSRDNYFWFYIKNLGLQYILALPAFLYADKSKKWLYAGGLTAFAVAEVILFQPNPYDNNKIIFIWYLMNCGLVMNFLIDIYKRLSDMRGIKTVAAVTIIIMNLSGVLTLGREAASKYTLFGKPHLEASEFIINNTAPDALFLTSNNHNNTVSSLTGRNIFLGSASYLYYHGISTWTNEQAQRSMFENPTMTDLITYGIDYVFVSDFEISNYKIDLYFFETNLEKVYSATGITIYAMPGLSN